MSYQLTPANLSKSGISTISTWSAFSKILGAGLIDAVGVMLGVDVTVAVLVAVAVFVAVAVCVTVFVGAIVGANVATRVSVTVGDGLNVGGVVFKLQPTNISANNIQIPILTIKNTIPLYP